MERACNPLRSLRSLRFRRAKSNARRILRFHTPVEPDSSGANMSLDLKKILANEEEVQGIAYWPGAVRYQVTVPAYQFVTLIGPLTGTDLFLNISARDSFDEGLGGSIFRFADSCAAELSPERDVTILEGFQHDGYPFDAILLLGAACHGLYETVSQELNRRTVVALPIARWEFTGNENPDDVSTIRHRGADTLNWKRTPDRPIALVRSRNENRDPITRGSKKPYYVRESSIIDDLLELPEDETSFVEVENFLSEHIRLVARTRKFAIAFGDRQVYAKKVKFGPEQVVVAKADIERWIHDFLTRGLPSSPM